MKLIAHVMMWVGNDPGISGHHGLLITSPFPSVKYTTHINLKKRRNSSSSKNGSFWMQNIIIYGSCFKIIITFLGKKKGSACEDALQDSQKKRQPHTHIQLRA